MDNNLDPHINVLWLSDIHYHQDYKNKQYHVRLQEYLEGFYKYLETFSDAFDYILLSGDIAQNGEKEDYQLFEKDILAPLQTKFSKAELIVIPGNHDVSRGNTNFLKEYIESEITRPDFFKKYKSKFFNIFNPYSTYFKSKNIARNASEPYKKGLLYGHVIDKKNNLIIVLLNSAWYSFGYTFLEYYLENDLHANKDLAVVKKEILKITSEYGWQMLGLEILEEVDEIIKILAKYPEYLVITTLHHPVSWLHKPDQITSDGGNFHSIKKHTDLMLTGHEHVHEEFPYEYLNSNKLLHLKAGCFADFSEYNRNKKEGEENLNPFKIKNNWFSTLKINTKKRTVAHHKHVFGAKGWYESEKNFKLLKLNKKHEVELLDTRLNELKTHIDANPSHVVNHLFSGIEPSNSDGIYPFGNNAVIFLTTDEIEFPADKIKNYFVNGGENRLYVVLVDLYNLKSARYSKETNRLKIANDIKTDYDFKFNDFRHDFFSKLEPEEVGTFGRLIFISKLIPFWELEY